MSNNDRVAKHIDKARTLADLARASNKVARAVDAALRADDDEDGWFGRPMVERDAMLIATLPFEDVDTLYDRFCIH